MIYFSNVKINIGLNVKFKRSDGFHELDSIFYPVPWCDLLEVIPSDQPGFEWSCSGLEIPGELEDNLIYKAYQLILENHAIGGVQVHLKKQIPMGAGLGGGSSNAAFMLMALNDLFDLNLTETELIGYAAKLGSDVPFFIKNKACRCEGRGEIMQEIDLDLSDYFIAIINPRIHVSTKDAFGGIQPCDRPIDLSIIQDIELWKESLSNDFEKTIFKIHPAIESLKNRMYEEGAIYASMTGSGSSVYGVFKSKPAFEADFIGSLSI